MMLVAMPAFDAKSALFTVYRALAAYQLNDIQIKPVCVL